MRFWLSRLLLRHAGVRQIFNIGCRTFYYSFFWKWGPLEVFIFSFPSRRSLWGMENIAKERSKKGITAPSASSVEPQPVQPPTNEEYDVDAQLIRDGEKTRSLLVTPYRFTLYRYCWGKSEEYQRAPWWVYLPGLPYNGYQSERLLLPA